MNIKLNSYKFTEIIAADRSAVQSSNVKLYDYPYFLSFPGYNSNIPSFPLN